MKNLMMVSALVVAALTTPAQGLAETVERAKVWTNFRSNQISLDFFMSSYSYSAKRAADGKVISLELPGVGEQSIPGAKNLRGQQAFYIRTNGLTSPLTAFPNHKISLAVAPVRVQNSNCAGGMSVRVQDLGVSIVNRTTKAQLPIGSAIVHAENDGTPLFQKMVDLSMSKPWHPGYAAECQKFGNDVYAGSALVLDRNEVTATVIFKSPECVSRHENDGSLFGKRYYYLEQPFTMTLTSRAGEVLLTAKDRTTYGVKDTRECQAIIRAR